MNTNDLSRLLGLELDNVADTSATSEYDNEHTTPEAGSSSYALAVDKWDIAQGDSIHDELSNRFPDVCADALTDFHSAYYHQQPILDEEGCVDPERYEFVEALLETPEYHALHTRTQSRPIASRVAAVTLAEEWAQLIGKRSSCVVNGQETVNDPKAAGKMGAAVAAAAAVDKATEQVDEVKEMQAALGAGEETGQETELDFQRMQDNWDRVRNNGRLRRIMEGAGRYRRVAQAKQRAKQQHGYDDMVGVELDGDVGRLLPLELAQLADEDFELDALRRVVERQAMCRKYRGIEKTGRGPIVVCVDESASMDGPKIIQAKQFALAMAWIAKHQKRYCALVSFSGSGCPGKICVLRPGKWNEQELMDWLLHFYDGGTRMHVPYDVVPFKLWPEMGAPKGKTDMIVITDGIVPVSDSMAEAYNEWREREKVKSITLIIGGGDPKDLRKTSDEIHNVQNMGLEEAGVQSCFNV